MRAIILVLALLAAAPAAAQAPPQNPTPATCPTARDGEPYVGMGYSPVPLADKQNRQRLLVLRLVKCGWSGDQIEAAQYYARAALAADLCSTWSRKLAVNPKVAADYLSKYRINPTSEGFPWAVEAGYLHWDIAMFHSGSSGGLRSFCDDAGRLFGGHGSIAAYLVIPVRD